MSQRKVSQILAVIAFLTKNYLLVVLVPNLKLKTKNTVLVKSS